MSGRWLLCAAQGIRRIGIGSLSCGRRVFERLWHSALLLYRRSARCRARAATCVPMPRCARGASFDTDLKRTCRRGSWVSRSGAQGCNLSGAVAFNLLRSFSAGDGRRKPMARIHTILGEIGGRLVGGHSGSTMFACYRGNIRGSTVSKTAASKVDVRGRGTGAAGSLPAPFKRYS